MTEDKTMEIKKVKEAKKGKEIMGQNANVDTSIPTGAEEGTPNKENLENLRADLADLIRDTQKAQETCVPPAVQEVVLAVRHLEDARMRLGVALAYVNGNNPLENK
jgi:hypothetical protein